MSKGSEQRVQWSKEYEKSYKRIFGMKDKNSPLTPPSNICDCCCGDGWIQMSCCGDDMKGRWEDNDLCPSCSEHCGEPEREECDECAGTGKESK